MYESPSCEEEEFEQHMIFKDINIMMDIRPKGAGCFKCDSAHIPICIENDHNYNI